jgi:hypothetical protein
MIRHILILVSFFLVGTSLAQSDTNLIKGHLKNITKTKGYRHFMNSDLLNKTADYILKDFEKYADTAFFQDFQVNGLNYKNVICRFGSSADRTVVIGAHYDVCGMQEGADDNASGVVGLLEMARQMKGVGLPYSIELVAYTLEEPPYFRTDNMGSYVHARSLFEEKRDVFGMISLEMIGYFTDEKRTQDYPIALLRLFYGNRGNFITLVNKFGKGKFSKRFTRQFKRLKVVKTKRFNGPKVLPGVDFSDHLNYWRFGFSALMVTDTAFYRNKNYHEQGDVMELLDLGQMAKVIDGVLGTLKELK